MDFLPKINFEKCYFVRITLTFTHAFFVYKVTFRKIYFRQNAFSTKSPFVKLSVRHNVFLLGVFLLGVFRQGVFRQAVFRQNFRPPFINLGIKIVLNALAITPCLIQLG